MVIPTEQSSYHNDRFLRLGEIVSGAEAEGAPNDWILAASAFAARPLRDWLSRSARLSHSSLCSFLVPC